MRSGDCAGAAASPRRSPLRSQRCSRPSATSRPSRVTSRWPASIRRQARVRWPRRARPPIWLRRRTRAAEPGDEIGEPRQSAGQGECFRVFADRAPMHRRAGIGRGLEIFAQRHAERLARKPGATESASISGGHMSESLPAKIDARASASACSLPRSAESAWCCSRRSVSLATAVARAPLGLGQRRLVGFELGFGRGEGRARRLDLGVVGDLFAQPAPARPRHPRGGAAAAPAAG